MTTETSACWCNVEGHPDARITCKFCDNCMRIHGYDDAGILFALCGSIECAGKAVDTLTWNKRRHPRMRQWFTR